MIKPLQPPWRAMEIPLWWLAPPPCPVGSMSLDSRVAGLSYESSSFATLASGGTITRAYCRAIYEESVSRCFILPPEQGEVRRSRIGGGERSEPACRMLIIPYDTAMSSRNADFMFIAP